MKKILVAATLMAFVGCAAALSANKKSPGKIENGAFAPERPPQDKYGADPALTCPGYGANGALEEELNIRGGAKRAQQDGRLCALADTMLGWKIGGEGEPPPESVRSFVSYYFGIPGQVRRMTINNIETEDPKNIATSAADAVANFAATAAHPLYGLMTERVKKGNSRLALVLYDDVVALDQPLPRKLAPNSSATLSGQLLGEYSKIKLEIVDPVGTMQKVGDQPGKSFKAELKCGDHPGKILVQMVAEKEGSETVVTSFPVYCAGEPPRAVKIPAVATGPVDLQAAEKQLLDLLNADRTTAGLKPLNSLPALSNLARDVAQKQAAGKGVTSTDLLNGLKEAEIAAPMLLESAAQAFSVDDIYSKLSDSPTDRTNTMNPDVTDIGVGMAKGPVIGDKQTYIAAALFVKQRAAADPAQVKAKLYEAIAKKRADARASPVEKDMALEGVAQAYADAAAAGDGKVPKEKEAEILAPLYKQSMAVQQLGGFVPDEATAIEVAEQPSIVGNAKIVGVGVGIGKSPQFGKGSPFVMVLMGTRHEAAKPTKGKPAPKKKK